MKLINTVFKSDMCVRDRHKACRHVCRACYENCMCSCHARDLPTTVTPIIDHHRVEEGAA